MLRAASVLTCLAAAPAGAQLMEPAAPAAAVPQGASGRLVIATPEATHELVVWAEETAHEADGEGHAFTVWALDGPERDFVGDAVMVLRAAPEGRGWSATGQITRLEGPDFHGAILDSSFGGAFAVTRLEEDAGGGVRLSGIAAGPMGRAQGDTGQNDFSETVPALAIFDLSIPATAATAPPPD